MHPHSEQYDFNFLIFNFNSFANGTISNEKLWINKWSTIIKQKYLSFKKLDLLKLKVFSSFPGVT